MKKRNYVFAGGVLLFALLLIISGVFRIVGLYESYRKNMLTYESRHFNSIVSTCARGMTWMISGYSAQMETLVERFEVEQAERQYAETGSTTEFQRLMYHPDILQIGMQCKLAVLDGERNLLAASDGTFPADNGEDEPLGENISIRQGDSGGFWVVVCQDSPGGLHYELAVSIHSLFSSQASSAHIGRSGYLFLLDREGRFFACSTIGETMTYSMEAAEMLFPEMDDAAIEELAAVGMAAPEDYRVYAYPWQDGEEKNVTTETLVVTYPVTVGDTSFVMGSAISFQEFSGFLTGMLDSVITVIILEIAGAAILILIIAWMLIRNRRSAMQMTVLRERADLMEEINRQQQSIAHNERLQQLGVMTSGMAHEFNNLMTPIMGQSHLLLEQLADQDDSPQFECALDIYEASEKARSIVKGMSSMSKKDVDLSFRTMDIESLLRKTLALAAMAKDPHVQERLIVPDEPLFISCNEQLLTQAFLNLFINGYQAMETEGTLTVAVERELRSGIEYARVEVRDTGPGIPENSLGQIYDPFYTTKGERGTGLGLMICQKTIETHKGTINAANDPDGGAVFTVRLPTISLEAE